MLRLLKFRNLEEGPEKLKLRRLRTGCASAHVASVTGVVQWGKTPPPRPRRRHVLLGAFVSERVQQGYFCKCWEKFKESRSAPGRQCFYQGQQRRLG